MKIKIGDRVYQKRIGHSGIPMRVYGLRQTKTPNGLVEQAFCSNWNGLLSEKYKVRGDWFAVNNLTHDPDIARQFWAENWRYDRIVTYFSVYN